MKAKPRTGDVELPDPRRVGQTIREIRRQRHLRQADLGMRIGMLPGPVSNIENGKNAPSLRTLCRIAKALDVTVDQLLYPDGYLSVAASKIETLQVREPQAEYAAKHPAAALYARLAHRGIARVTRIAGETARLTPRVRRTLEERINEFLMLEDLCRACKRALIPLYAPLTLDAKGAEQLAYAVRTHCGIGAAVVFDYVELFENQGFRILFVKLPASIESLSFYDVLNHNVFIFLADGFNPEKQLFRMAFELANIFLFTANHNQPVAESDETRRFAKQFASYFLMPREAVHATVMQLALGPRDWTFELLLRIKHRFGVSAEAFAHRLEEVGVLDPALRLQFKAHILKHYAGTDFGEPDSSRRILSRNGRLGDLLLCARRRTDAPEIEKLAQRLRRDELRQQPVTLPPGKNHES